MKRSFAMDLFNCALIAAVLASIIVIITNGGGATASNTSGKDETRLSGSAALTADEGCKVFRERKLNDDGTWQVRLFKACE